MAEQNPRIAGSKQTADDPYTGAVIIDYSGGDQTLSVYARGVFISTAGNLKVDMLDGQTVTFLSLPVGIHRICFRKIYQTGSAAAGLVLL